MLVACNYVVTTTTAKNFRRANVALFNDFSLFSNFSEVFAKTESTADYRSGLEFTGLSHRGRNHESDYGQITGEAEPAGVTQNSGLLFLWR